MSIDIDLLMEPKVFTYNQEYLSNEGLDYHFIIIGAGGTGGYLIPNLARMVSIKNGEGADHQVTIVDADRVEQKNLLRQNFTDSDIGKNKAAVMAGRYGRAFKQTFYFIEEYIENYTQIVDIIESENKIPVIIDCVDNNKTRFIIEEARKSYMRTNPRFDVLVISSGNEEFAGQVIFSYELSERNKYHYERIGEIEDGVYMKHESPSLIDIFPNMKIGKLPDEESCAEQAISAPQNIHTNMTAADIQFGFINRLLNKEKIDILAVFFDSFMMTRSIYSSRATHAKQLLSMVENNQSLIDYFPEESIDKKNAVVRPSYEEVINFVEEEEEEEEELSESDEALVNENNDTPIQDYVTWGEEDVPRFESVVSRYE